MHPLDCGQAGQGEVTIVAADESHDAPHPEPVHVARHVGYVKPLFGPPTTKMAFARHLHDKPSPTAAPQAEPRHDAVGNETNKEAELHDAARQMPGDGDDSSSAPLHLEHAISKDREDTRKAYQEAKMKVHLGAKAAAAAEAAEEGVARAGGEGANMGGNEVPRHQLDMPRTWKPPKRPGHSQFDARPLVYTYDLPTPLINCSWDDWASFNYGAEVRLPEVNPCPQAREACTIDWWRHDLSEADPDMSTFSPPVLSCRTVALEEGLVANMYFVERNHEGCICPSYELEGAFIILMIVLQLHLLKNAIAKVALDGE